MLSHKVPRGARHSSPGTSTPPARHRRDFTPSTRFSKTSCFHDRPCRSSRPSRCASRSGRTGCGRGLAAAAQRSPTCRGGVSRDALSRARIWHLASVRRRRRRPFEIKGPLLMLHHLWCAATLAKGVCPTSELGRGLKAESVTEVATCSACCARGAGRRPRVKVWEENDSKTLRVERKQR